MEAVKLSQVSQASFTNKQEIQKEIPKAPEQKKNGIELLEKEANALALNAKASLTFTGDINKLQNAIQDGIPKISDIKFFHGRACLKADGKSFSGLVSDTLNNGDTIKMLYQDGMLQMSERKGVINFLKTFIYSPDDGFLKKVITKKPGVLSKAVYERGSDGKIHRFIASEYDREKIILETNMYGKPAKLTKGKFFKSWDDGDKLSDMYARKIITNLDGNEVEISLDIRNGKITCINCGEDYGILKRLERSGSYYIYDYKKNNKTTPQHLIEVLEEFGFKNAREMIQELNLEL